MRIFWGTVKNYWFDGDTNIFKNYIDAFFGLFVLFVLPCISLITVFFIETASWPNYTFPIFSIVIADLYDVVGRYEYKAEKNIKLSIRAGFDLLSLFLAALFIGKSGFIICLAPALLLLSGILISIEAFTRIMVGIRISKWYVDIKGE